VANSRWFGAKAPYHRNRWPNPIAHRRRGRMSSALRARLIGRRSCPVVSRYALNHRLLATTPSSVRCCGGEAAPAAAMPPPISPPPRPCVAREAALRDVWLAHARSGIRRLAFCREAAVKFSRGFIRSRMYPRTKGSALCAATAAVQVCSCDPFQCRCRGGFVVSAVLPKPPKGGGLENPPHTFLTASPS